MLPDLNMPGKQRILILDDEEEILELMSRILGSTYTLLTKTGTEDLENVVNEFRPGVIIIDHFIGDQTSKEIIARSLRHLDIPVILHSGHTDIEKLSLGIKVAGYIKKPSSIGEIRQRVAEALGTD